MSSMTTTDNKAFLNELARLVGHSHLLTDPAKTARYRKGFRSGQGRRAGCRFPWLTTGIVAGAESLRHRRQNYSDAGCQYRPDRRIDAKR
ncbi:D-lactate dehydrogenase [Escherichia coli]|uniref:D-lactate dehydrogenase n=1 Tax=Escherichia coli TaxID=562 RepID=A0A377BBE7_ECOLX|nr:D-lactate dehydrogenase [Escherichia coli]